LHRMGIAHRDHNDLAGAAIAQRQSPSPIAPVGNRPASAPRLR
jgi:hypothetical protein